MESQAILQALKSGAISLELAEEKIKKLKTGSVHAFEKYFAADALKPPASVSQAAFMANQISDTQSDLKTYNHEFTPFRPENLGNPIFQKRYQCRFNYFAGSMFRGIASVEMVVAMAKAGLLCFFGSAGLDSSTVESHIQELQRQLGSKSPYGMCLINNIYDPRKEQAHAELIVKYNLPVVEAAAFSSITAPLVYCRIKGLQRRNGRLSFARRVIAKCSRLEIARMFLSPPPSQIVAQLLEADQLTSQEAELAKSIPMADDLAVEADSGGHTDQGAAFALIPALISLRDDMQRQYRYCQEIMVGCGGGIGTPQAVAAAFMLGADFVFTGSINQCTVESGTHPRVKDLLATLSIHDTTMAVAGDMFEIGAKVQVVKKGTRFAARANRLHQLFLQYNGLKEIPATIRKQLETQYFKRTFDQVWDDVLTYKGTKQSAQIAEAEQNPRLKLVLIFKWFFARTNQLARSGDEAGKDNWQIHCGPALGAFNQWAKGSHLENWSNRHVDQIAEALMNAACQHMHRRLIPNDSPVSSTRETACQHDPVAIQMIAEEKQTLTPTDPKIAIIGMAGQFPQSENIAAFWANIADGKNCIGEIPAERWSIDQFFDPNPQTPDKTHCRWMGAMPYADRFDPLFFNISPAEAEIMDPQQRLFLQHCWHCVEDAGLCPTALSGSRLGVFVGCTSGDYSQSAQGQQLNAQGLMGSSSSILSARISYMLNLKGPSVSIDTACSSSLVALAQACDSLVLKNCDMALAGGVYVISGPAMHIMAAKAGILSSQGRCHTFDSRADGFVPGEGVGVVLLKRFSDAVRDGDPIHAVLRGWGVNQDGKTNGITAPSVNSQILLEKEVFDRFKIDPETITLVEAHGTATQLGDPIEVEALTEAFFAHTDKKNYCALGSSKSNIGHLMTSAGIAGLIKVVLALKHRQLPPTINYENLNPHIELKDSPFYINTCLRPWKDNAAAPRRASVSSFGFSGTNAFTVIEEYRPAADHLNPKINIDTDLPFIFILSAKTEAQLDDYLRTFQYYLQATDNKLDDMVYTLQLGRDAMPWRFACVVNSKDSLRKALQAGLDKQTLPYVFKAKAGKNPSTKPEEQGKTIGDLIQSQSYPQLAQRWVRGESVDWRLLYKDRPPAKRIHLPVYPFARERYWLDMAALSPGQQQKPDSPPGQPDTNAKILNDGRPTAEKFDAKLGALCWTPCWKDAQSGAANKTEAPLKTIVLICELGDHFNLHRIESQIRDAKVLALQSAEKPIDTRYMRYAAKIFDVIKNVIKARAGRVLIQIVSAEDGEAAILTGLFSIVQTARLENPGIMGQLIQVDRDVSTNTLLGILQQNSTVPQDLRVRYHHRVRQILHWQPLDTLSRPIAAPWKDQSVYLITGGIGGLGLIFAKEIARQIQNSTLILSGRTPFNAAIEAQTKALSTAGVRVVYQPCDISSPQDTHRLIQGILQDFGGLQGIVHSAGVVRDNFIIRKTRAEMQQVLLPKVAGLVNLDHASRDVNLDFFICFSSGAGVTGNVGQADYAAANAFMDAYAGYRNSCVAHHKRFGRTLSINWPYWQDGGMRIDDVTAQTMRQKVGMVPMPTAEGLDAFYRSWQAGLDQVMVMFGEADGISAAMHDFTPAGSEKMAVSDWPGANWSYNLDRLMEQTNDQLKQLLSNVIKLDVARIDVHEPLESYGIDSLMINRLNSALAEVFGELSKTLFFEFQTLAALSDYLVDEHHEACLKWTGAKPSLPTGRLNVKPTPHRPTDISRAADTGSDAVRPALSVAFNNRQGIQEPVAIIGMSGRYPQAPDLQAFWKNLKEGRDCITEIPPERWSLKSFFEPDPQKAVAAGKSYSKWGGFIDGFADFDPAFYNISPREAINMDPQEKLFITACWQAVEDAGYTKAEIAKRYDNRVGVFAGITKTGFDLYGPQLWQKGKAVYPHTSFASVANRISYLMNLKGPSMPIDTMCSSSLTAVHEACRKLHLGECDMAIAGGVNLYLHPTSYVLLCAQQMLSKDRRNRSFGLGGNGFVPGEGVGVVLLKSLSRAIADHDRIYAVIRGTAINHGGKTNGYTVPNPTAQTEVILAAMERAGVDARRVSYIEAHGTGTELGDPVEITGLTQAFKKYTSDLQFCAIGSVKSNLGHLEAAAGIAGMTKIILQMQHRQLVPSLNAEALNPNIDFSLSPFRVQRKLFPWERPKFVNNGDKQRFHRIAGISSFGAGGANAHVILEEYRPSQRPSTPVCISADDPAIIVLSAHADAQLKTYARHLVRFIRENKHRAPDSGPEIHLDLADMAYTLQTGREAFHCRLAVITTSIDDLEEKLLGFIENQKDRADVFTGKVDQHQKVLSFFEDDVELHEAIGKWIRRRKWDKLLKLWVQGLAVDWHALYHADSTPSRMHLPTYPFNMQRFWALEKVIAADNRTASQDRIQSTRQTKPQERYNRMSPPKPFTKAVFAKPQGIVLADPKAFDHQAINHNVITREKQNAIIPEPPSVIRPAASASEKTQPQANAGTANHSPETLRKELVTSLAEVLFMRPQGVDVNKRFVDLGMDSIIAVEWVKNLNKLYHCRLDATIIYDHSTIIDLAAYLSKHLRQLPTNCTDQPIGNSSAVVVDPTIASLSQECPADETTLNTARTVSSESMDSQSLMVEFSEPPRDVPIAVIGMSGRYPMAENLTEFWENLKAGKNCIQEVPQERWHAASFYDPVKGKPGKACSKWGGFIKDADKFDHEFFNLSPKDAKRLHPEVRLFMQTVWEAVEDAGYAREELDRRNKEKGLKIGVFVGCMYQHYPYLAGDDAIGALLGGSSYWAIANQISYFMNFKGPSMAVDTACSSSLVAIHLACESIHRNECAMALAGGVNLNLHAAKYIVIADAGGLGSRDKSMSLGDGDGMVPGEGVGAVFLKPLPQAIRDRDNIYGVIKGSAMGHCGASNGFAAPDANAQAELIAAVITKTGIDPSSIQYIDAAANGAALGDAIEVKGLIRAYRQFTKENEFCGIGSVKSNIGHLEAASGISQLTKVLLQLKYKQRVQTLNAEPLNPNIQLAGSPFYIQKDPCDWKAGRGLKNGTVTHPRRAAISSFGGGGTNVHMIVEEYPTDDNNDLTENLAAPELFVFSARDKYDLKALIRKIKQFLEEIETISLASMAHTLRHGREQMPARLALTAKSKSELIGKLDDAFKRRVELPGLYRDQIDINREASPVNEKGHNWEQVIEKCWDRRDLGNIAKIWESGIRINWSRLSLRAGCKFISLPTYEFKKNRHWIDGSATRPPVESQTGVKYLQDHAVKEESEVKSSDKPQTNQYLRALYANLLGIAETELDLDKSLQAYGFDSIKATKMRYKIEEIFQRTIPIAVFGNNRTLRELDDRLTLIIDHPNRERNETQVGDPVIDIEALSEAELSLLADALREDLSRTESAQIDL